jgi:hypothetical protein
MFCAPGHVFGDYEGVGSRFHVLCARTHFRRYRRRRVPFSCFALLDTFSMVRRASGPIFVFCAPGLVFGGSEGVRSRLHVLRLVHILGVCKGVRSRFCVLRSRTRFSAVARASGPVFKFCAPGHVLSVWRASGPVFIFCAP